MQCKWQYSGSFLNNIERALICTDSVSTSTSIKTGGSASHQDLVIDIITEYRKCLGKGLRVRFFWTPAHMGIWGNERADKVAKQAKRSGVEREVRLSKSEGKSIVWRKAIDSGNRIGRQKAKGGIDFKYCSVLAV